jgi:Uma2 family endonuclease
MALTRRELTLDEFLELPEEKPALEYVDGVVRQKVAPKPRHSALQVWFTTWLQSRLGPAKQARVFTELRTTYAGTSRVPDLAVYRWERVPRDAARRLAPEALTPPDLAIEIRSPGQSIRDLTRTCEWYVEHGVQIALLVDDADASIRVFRPNAPASVFRLGDQVDLGEIAAGLRLAVDEVFEALDAD